MALSAFFGRMQGLLGPEFEAFRATFDQPRVFGLRTNTLKIAPERLQELLGMALEPVPWTPGAFYFPETERPGIHPFHAAGLYYIQEPSASAAARSLQPRPGERVLDLCAAPGGKATHLAALMQNQGLLVANEIHPKRAQILAENLERCGVTCALVTQEDPDRLAERFPAFFDRILVDAPCSGEGMFRKDPDAVAEWSPESPVACALRQEKILDAALRMLRPGGHLLYSTCTFAPEENEQNLLWLLRHYPDLQVVEMPALPGAAPGRSDWAGDPTPAEAAALGRAARLWPHRLRGEGHFIALLQKGEDPGARVADAGSVEAAAPRAPLPGRAQQRKPAGKGDPEASLKDAVALFQEFASRSLTGMEFPGPFQLWGEALYLVSPLAPGLGGLKVVRPGLHLGFVRKNRFEPAHALALALPAGAFRQQADFPAASREIQAYLRGETLEAGACEGWTAVTVQGCPIGWAKASAGVLKNHFPRGLRWTE